MKVCIDCTLLRKNQITGVERYIIELIKGFIQLLNDSDLELVLLFNKDYRDGTELFKHEKIELINLKSSYRIINDQILIPLISYTRKDIDLFHFPVFFNSFFFGNKFVLTNHDSTFWKYPERISKGAKYYYKPLYKRSLNKADRIITVSNSSKTDLLKFTNSVENKIDVIYEALSSQFEENNFQASKSDLEKFGLKSSYILTVGTVEPRKNLLVLISAFEKLTNEHKINKQLVIVGRNGWGNKFNQFNSESNICFTGYVSEKDLKNLYSCAEIFVFPTIYEGFGFPLLEAMSFELPIICSNTSSLPEVGGDACLYVNDPSSVDEFSNKIKFLLENDEAKKTLRKKSKLNLKRFNWFRTASETLNVYERIYG